MSFQQVLSYYGVETSGGWKNVHCVSLTHDDLSKSARASVEDEGYFCNACELKAGDPIQLIMRIEHIDRHRANSKYKEITGDSYRNVSRAGEGRRPATEVSSRGAGLLDRGSGLLPSRRRPFTD